MSVAPFGCSGGTISCNTGVLSGKYIRSGTLRMAFASGSRPSASVDGAPAVDGSEGDGDLEGVDGSGINLEATPQNRSKSSVRWISVSKTEVALEEPTNSAPRRPIKHPDPLFSAVLPALYSPTLQSPLP